MRGARCSILGLSLLAAAQVPMVAAETAPLESTKQELRQLESTQKNKAGSATTDQVKMDTPVLDVRGATGPIIEPWDDRRKAEERKRQQKQRNADNWLVNGVEQLSREGTATTETTTDVTVENESLSSEPDSSDPQYLLKLFDEQKKHSEGKEAAAKPRATPAPDPFAPFLQDWLGSSPVRNQVMEQFRRSGESGGAVVAPESRADFRGPEAAIAGTNPASAPDQSAGPKPNPYLTGLSAPIQSNEMLAGSAPLAAIDRALSNPQPSPVVTVSPAASPDVRTPVKGPPPGLADDKKYFPQLKKF